MASSECISEKSSTSVELTQDDIPGASLNEPFHGILKVRTLTPTQANGRFQEAMVLFFSHKKNYDRIEKRGCTPDVTSLLIIRHFDSRALNEKVH